MRYDSEHKQKTHLKVVKAAAKAIRAEGPHRIGVAAVMADAGLTHGGFYAHFASKDDLVAAAIEHMFEESRERLRHETEDRDPREALIAYIDFYLSAKHRDSRRSGCPLAALASDLPRLAPGLRARFAKGAQRLASAFSELLSKLDHNEATEEANSMLAELLGALSLARMEANTERSDAILAASRQQLKRRLALEQYA
ncbi:TetR/AcrR family transcriptional regulator [Pseudolysobacter antarcticus]|uniref:TetR/AcrR family transcriptional regulator n=1 Tax=Pseudolysobacter antarcticus TaxID=2511995 RepID=A0A411HLX6_9GAMM|nr:TetR/AcrR family transcriptional regulator [Pseudolysobacter antarcticus]QBB71503.1 TetR/AcrR family transcriptional regulator [Pseudolysobacter antarcticus]